MSYWFETETGSRYEVDIDAMTMVRKGDHPLRRDGEAIPLLLNPRPPEIGESFVALLDVRRDGVPTVRTTSPVVGWGVS